MQSICENFSAQLAQASIPFVVPTPVPYVVDLAQSKGTPDEARARLVAKVDVLMQVLGLLGISTEEAREKGYSLNRYTYHTLSQLALYAGWSSSSQVSQIALQTGRNPSSQVTAENGRSALALLDSHSW